LLITPRQHKPRNRNFAKEPNVDLFPFYGKENIIIFGLGDEGEENI